MNNVLSLFNGMSFCKMALEALDVEVDKYYSAEINHIFKGLLQK